MVDSHAAMGGGRSGGDANASNAPNDSPPTNVLKKASALPSSKRAATGFPMTGKNWPAGWNGPATSGR